MRSCAIARWRPRKSPRACNICVLGAGAICTAATGIHQNAGDERMRRAAELDRQELLTEGAWITSECWMQRLADGLQFRSWKRILKGGSRSRS